MPKPYRDVKVPLYRKQIEPERGKIIAHQDVGPFQDTLHTDTPRPDSFHRTWTLPSNASVAQTAVT